MLETAWLSQSVVRVVMPLAVAALMACMTSTMNTYTIEADKAMGCSVVQTRQMHVAASSCSEQGGSQPPYDLSSLLQLQWKLICFFKHPHIANQTALCLSLHLPSAAAARPTQVQQSVRQYRNRHTAVHASLHCLHITLRQKFNAMQEAVEPAPEQKQDLRVVQLHSQVGGTEVVVRLDVAQQQGAARHAVVVASQAAPCVGPQHHRVLRAGLQAARIRNQAENTAWLHIAEMSGGC